MTVFKYKITFSLSVTFFLLSLFSLLFTGVFLYSISGEVKARAVENVFIHVANRDAKLVENSLIYAMRDHFTSQKVGDVIGSMDLGLHHYVSFVPGSKDSPTVEAIEISDDGEFVNYHYPVLTTKKCVSCHTQAVGSVIGTINITYPSSSVVVPLNYSVKTALYYTFFGMWLLFAVLYLNLKFNVWEPILAIAKNIRAITDHKDWSKRVTDVGRIKELSGLAFDFNAMVGAVEFDHAQLENLATRDPLTDLLNRRGFENALHDEFMRAERHECTFSVISLDLDNFKGINDTFGHPAGDLVLIELGMRINKCLRKSDVSARLGGDEFMILLRDTDCESSLRAAHKIHEFLSTIPFSLTNGQLIAVTASLGVANYPKDATTLESMHAAVDNVLYQAKRMGKNHVASSQCAKTDKTPINTQSNRMPDRFKRAMNSGNITVALQPIVGFNGKGTVAYEALARMIENGVYVPACEFIEEVEKAGLCQSFDDLMLRKVASELKHIPTGKVFVNLSSASFGDVDWMLSIPSILAEHDIPCSRIVLEITEREALPHLGGVRTVIDKLRGAGIQFALDDFGSGFSSFLYIKHFDIDYIKIDGSFVQQLANNPHDRIIVENIRRVAADFGLTTIAEFVEDEATAVIVFELGVDYAQGHFFGHPTLITHRPDSTL